MLRNVDVIINKCKAILNMNLKEQIERCNIRLVWLGVTRHNNKKSHAHPQFIHFWPCGRYDDSKFITYVCFLLFFILLSLRVDGTITWNYGAVFFPLWLWHVCMCAGVVVGVVFYIKTKTLRLASRLGYERVLQVVTSLLLTEKTQRTASTSQRWPNRPPSNCCSCWPKSLPWWTSRRGQCRGGLSLRPCTSCFQLPFRASSGRAAGNAP